jgi:uncharacterized protein YegP (UPF0339 family)
MKCEFNFEIRKNTRSKQPYWWVCKAANGQIKFHSENYLRRGSAVNSIKQLTKYLRPGVEWRVK